MKKSDFYYELPKELIAQDPLADRSSSRLMYLPLEGGETRDLHFSDIKQYLKKGDCLVLNDTKVIPARLLGQRENSGGAIELLLLKRKSEYEWECLTKPGKKCREGSGFTFGDGRLRAEVVRVLEDGNRIVRFEYEGIWEEILDSLGQMPLPPYITHTLQDRDRYQTVYAKNTGSAAAPTAGLHFTKELLGELEEMGVRLAYVTLHVGLGTFRPVKEEEVLDHHMHSEFYSVSKETAELINEVKLSGSGRIICVGTTSCRTIESAAYFDEEKGSYLLRAGSADTEIFIYPGYEFKMLQGLITNFHLPESTLIMLVSALAGRERVLEAYGEAVEKKYRFFSFGDAMLLL